MDVIARRRSSRPSRSRRPRRTVALASATIVALLGLGVVLASGASAGGGGPVLLPPDGSSSTVFNAGDRVHLVAQQLYKEDRAWYGPYVVYLRPDRPLEGLAGLAPAGEGSYDVAVGNLEVNRLDEWTTTAEITFTMPKLEDGRYRVMTCNAKCANPLGQLRESSLIVGAPPLPSVPPTFDPTLSLPLSPSSVSTVTAKIGTVATTIPPGAASAPPVVVDRVVTVTNWPAVAAAFAFGIAVAWGVPSLVARRRRPAAAEPAPLRKHRSPRSSDRDADVADFIPVEAVHEESLV